jgi:hypothetical protein
MPDIADPTGFQMSDWLDQYNRLNRDQSWHAAWDEVQDQRQSLAAQALTTNELIDCGQVTRVDFWFDR